MKPARDVGNAALVEVAQALPSARVLVIGDLMLDRYVSGSAARLSPEAPIPVLRPQRQSATLGGAANVALNVAALGGNVGLVGVIGEDKAGMEMLSMLDEARIRRSLLICPGRPTTVKTRFMAGSHQLMRLDEETTNPLRDEEAAALLDRVEAELPTADVLVLSDYAKGVLCDSVLSQVVTRSRQSGCVVIADPKRVDFSVYRGVTVLTPNESEARLATRVDAGDDPGAERAGRFALEMTGAEAVLVTRSERGLTLVRAGHAAQHFPTQAREVADVSGAGDTLVATLAIALAVGAGLPEAAQLANITAGIAVGKQGTATVGREEVLGVLHLEQLLATDRKIATREQALSQVAAWRSQRLKVGLANGCFDLIHPGHVRLLSQARAACDRLVVALNSDSSVARLKGPSRPIQNETARATVMASLAPVDLVVLFGEDTPLELIRDLRPDVLVKGSDYTMDQVVGADLVAGWGGKVVLVELQAGHSTTGTILRMASHVSA